MNVPEKVREATCGAWGSGSPEGRHHAAKQLACYLLNSTRMEEQDSNAVVDSLLWLGMAAVQRTDAADLLWWFERNKEFTAWLEAGTREHYTLKDADVGKPAIRVFGREWLVSNFIGRVLKGDVGKRVFLVGDILQVENDEQRDARLAVDARRSEALPGAG